MIKLTPGDKNYLKHHGVLYVTLTSAFPLPRTLVSKVDSVVSGLVSEVGGKISLWVLEDSSLIAGLKLKVGDTVYDGTVSEALYHFKNSILRDVIEKDDSTEELAKEFFEKCFSAIPDFSADEAIIIGDSLSSDIKGGINAGIRTCLFNPKKKENLSGIIPDFEVANLSEIPTLLERI
jgi:hypothetical protein